MTRGSFTIDGEKITVGQAGTLINAEEFGFDLADILRSHGPLSDTPHGRLMALFGTEGSVYEYGTDKLIPTRLEAIGWSEAPDALRELKAELEDEFDAIYARCLVNFYRTTRARLGERVDGQHETDRAPDSMITNASYGATRLLSFPAEDKYLELQSGTEVS